MDAIRRPRPAVDGDLCRLSVADQRCRSAHRDPSHGIADAAQSIGREGRGESGTIGAPAAIVSAIEDALAPLGISIRDLPVTPPLETLTSCKRIGSRASAPEPSRSAACRRLDRMPEALASCATRTAQVGFFRNAGDRDKDTNLSDCGCLPRCDGRRQVADRRDRRRCAA